MIFSGKGWLMNFYQIKIITNTNIIVKRLINHHDMYWPNDSKSNPSFHSTWTHFGPSSKLGYFQSFVNLLEKSCAQSPHSKCDLQASHRLITERPWNSTPVQKSHLCHSLNLLSTQEILLLTHVCTCMCVYVCVCICMCVYVFVCVCMYVAALMVSAKVYKGSPCGWPEVEGLSLFCICPSNRSYWDVFLSCAVCMHTGLRAAIDMYISL